MKKNGFTLIELMIVVSIIGVLASISIPVYQDYTRTTIANTALMEAAGFKTEVVICYQTTFTITHCDQNHDKISIPPIGGNVDRVETNGVIYLNMGDLDGQNGNEVVSMTPIVTNGTIVRWSLADISGTACSSGWLSC
jgi:prepilin-type N-terminal cleavage/methylation domain-containing protein